MADTATDLAGAIRAAVTEINRLRQRLRSTPGLCAARDPMLIAALTQLAGLGTLIADDLASTDPRVHRTAQVVEQWFDGATLAVHLVQVVLSQDLL
jgi:hypothetical protein